MLSFENILYLVFMILAVVSGFIRIRPLRWIIMVSALISIGFLQMGCPSPMGALQNICVRPFPIQKSGLFFIKLAIVTVPAFFFGPVFCGKVCPKGTIQELLHRKEFKVKIPSKLDRWLGYLPFFILVAVIVSGVFFHHKLITANISPFKVIFNLMGSPQKGGENQSLNVWKCIGCGVCKQNCRQHCLK